MDNQYLTGNVPKFIVDIFRSWKLSNTAERHQDRMPSKMGNPAVSFRKLFCRKKIHYTQCIYFTYKIIFLCVLQDNIQLQCSTKLNSIQILPNSYVILLPVSSLLHIYLCQEVYHSCAISFWIQSFSKPNSYKL